MIWRYCGCATDKARKESKVNGCIKMTTTPRQDDATKIAIALLGKSTFTTSKGMTGSPFRPGTIPDLPMPHLSEVLAKLVRYVVHSDNMPIAYNLENGIWILPTFSEGTKSRKNQDILRRALATVNSKKKLS